MPNRLGRTVSIFIAGCVLFMECSVRGLASDASILIDPIPPVAQGGELSVQCVVKNTSSASRAFGEGAEIEDGNSVVQSIGATTTAILEAGASGSVLFTWSLPSNWTPKEYTFHAAVWDGKPGSGTWLIDASRTFSYGQKPLRLTGRIAYHTYSAWMAEAIDDLDGNIFIYDLANASRTNATDGLGIANAMNPSFSPDGARIAFMARPITSPLARASLEIYTLDLATRTLSQLTSNSIPDEDPKFSPDGASIVFKRTDGATGVGQIYRMSSDGSAVVQLTNSLREKSGPCFSPDGARIAFWYDSRSSADLGCMNATAPNSDTVLVHDANRQAMYPAFLDPKRVLFSKWESSVPNPEAPNPSDDVYLYTMSSKVSTRLPFNLPNVEDADAAPIDARHCVFSSTRSAGNYDLYIGDIETGEVYSLPNANSPHQELGPCYSPFSVAQNVKIVAPKDGH